MYVPLREGPVARPRGNSDAVQIHPGAKVLWNHWKRQQQALEPGWRPRTSGPAARSWVLMSIFFSLAGCYEMLPLWLSGWCHELQAEERRK